MLSDAERKALLDLGTKFNFVNSGEDVSDGPGALATMTHQKDCKTYRKARWMVGGQFLGGVAGLGVIWCLKKLYYIKPIIN